MLGISFLNEEDGELFRAEVQRTWITRLKAVDVLSRLHPNFDPSRSERGGSLFLKHAGTAKEA